MQKETANGQIEIKRFDQMNRRLEQVERLNDLMMVRYSYDNSDPQASMRKLLSNSEYVERPFEFKSLSSDTQDIVLHALRSYVEEIEAINFSMAIDRVISFNENACLDISDVEFENDPLWEDATRIIKDKDNKDIKNSFYVGRRRGYEAVLKCLSTREGPPLEFHTADALKKIPFLPHEDSFLLRRYTFPTNIVGVNFDMVFPEGEDPSYRLIINRV